MGTDLEEVNLSINQIYYLKKKIKNVLLLIEKRNRTFGELFKKKFTVVSLWINFSLLHYY